MRNQTFDFATTMGNEGGATNSAPYIVGASPKGGFAFGLLFNSPSFGGMSVAGADGQQGGREGPHENLGHQQDADSGGLQPERRPHERGDGEPPPERAGC